MTCIVYTSTGCYDKYGIAIQYGDTILDQDGDLAVIVEENGELFAWYYGTNEMVHLEEISLLSSIYV